MNKATRRQQRVALQRILRQAREGAHLRQEDLAARLGRPQSFVSKYESGERRLDVLELAEVCAALDMDLAVFVATLQDDLRPSCE